jgi:hypothetical protein
MLFLTLPPGPALPVADDMRYNEKMYDDRKT